MAKNDNANLIDIRKNKKEIMEAARITAEKLDRENNITITVSDAIPTIAYEFIKNLFDIVVKNKSMTTDIEIDFAGLMDIGVSYRDGEDGEKDGNFTPYLNAGQEFKLMTKSDDESED